MKEKNKNIYDSLISNGMTDENIRIIQHDKNNTICSIEFDSSNTTPSKVKAAISKIFKSAEYKLIESDSSITVRVALKPEAQNKDEDVHDKMEKAEMQEENGIHAPIELDPVKVKAYRKETAKVKAESSSRLSSLSKGGEISLSDLKEAIGTVAEEKDKPAITVNGSKKIDVNKVRKTIGNALKAMEDIFVDRKPIIKAMAIAGLAKEHLFFLGAPGNAKTEMAEAMAHVFGDGKFFHWQFNRFTTDSEIFGCHDLKALKEGHYRRIMKGKLPEARFAVLDEYWNASSAVANTTNSILNERVFFNNGDPVHVPLVSAILASNTLPEDDSLKATYDRIMFRFKVEYVSDKDMFKVLSKVSKSGNNSKAIRGLPTIKDVELEAAQQAVMEVDCKQITLDSLVLMRSQLKVENIHPSDRRIVRLLKVLRASAWLDGRSEVNEDDIEVLRDCLWDNPDQIPAVKKVVGRCANPALSKAQEILDAIVLESKNCLATWGSVKQNASVEHPPVPTADMLAVIKRCKLAVETIEECVQQSAKANICLASVQTLLAKLNQEILGFKPKAEKEVEAK